MSRVALINCTWGFFLIFAAACGGAFVAAKASEIFVQQLTPGWQQVLEASSHGHTSLFGILHILLGLTMPYAQSIPKVDVIKSLGLFLGSFAMGPLLLLRAYHGPTLSTDITGVMVGVGLSCALGAILIHTLALGLKIQTRL